MRCGAQKAEVVGDQSVVSTGTSSRTEETARALARCAGGGRLGIAEDWPGPWLIVPASTNASWRDMSFVVKTGTDEERLTLGSTSIALRNKAPQQLSWKWTIRIWNST